MGRKTVVWMYLIVLSLGTILSLYIPKNEVTAKEAVTIPGDAIRLRILANSDLESDQALKRKVRDAVNAKITVWVKDLTSLKDARAVIVSKLPELQATAEEVVKREGATQAVNVKFGKVQFPTKLYGEFLYPAGEYEAVLITLGEGKGANWWCVLFPPLCFLDFSNGVAVSDGFEDKKQAVAATSQAQVSSEQSGDAQVSVKDKQAWQSEEVVVQTPGENRSAQQAPIQETNKHQVQTEKSQHVVAKVGEQPRREDRQVKVAVKAKESPLPNTAQEGANQQQEETVIAEERAAAPVAKQESVVDPASEKQTTPVYTAEDEQPVKVKFFVVELWEKLFN